ncbi:hypothetical protein AAFF_G00085650 [Aldrovandia affinis]|uniref:Uncharacterized protein n=1 Tax=Aldrovandia affinis TaxID=143900 RepID=A0AAD7RWR9_9TELE|nr:hypothetical protein AAFF_G00085650 [Aldrovandia affinis]
MQIRYRVTKRGWGVVRPPDCKPMPPICCPASELREERTVPSHPAGSWVLTASCFERAQHAWDSGGGIVLPSPPQTPQTPQAHRSFVQPLTGAGPKAQTEAYGQGLPGHVLPVH